MAQVGGEEVGLNRKYAQLLRVQERLLDYLERVRGELDAPTTREMLQDVRGSAGSAIPDCVREIDAAVEEAIRAVQLCQSEINRELIHHPDSFSVEGISNLPGALSRFLAERAETPGFKYEILQDPIRGWIVRWKEYTEMGTVRGHGQFYERPYAGIDD
jgi:hypothetical protein